MDPGQSALRSLQRFQRIAPQGSLRAHHFPLDE
ncbi:hypothetical protein COLO4_34349 [Corchorus olitorius]|uniref:Uncharacterized protein n=1 Tax=Corchorus olitorius TaxID=93759 RepID=A0A1R3GLF0_9ROSI|nr:hypothetical protein COLO4_34349 [Corchorus olitorius]